VRNPGLFDVDPTMRIADLLAMAGGVTQDGDRGRVELIRDGRPISASLSEQDVLASVALRSGDQLRVGQRGWLARNTGVVAAAITGAALVGAAVIRP
jgi:protein involved in polysaccharide export with SLBB domain